MPCSCTKCQKMNPLYGGCNSWGHGGLQFGVYLLIGVITFVLLMVFVIGPTMVEANERAINNIDGLGCFDLAEYIANKDPNRDYAEHRYTWLCVEQKLHQMET